MPKMLVVLIVGLLASGCSSLPKVYEFHDPLTPAEHLALGVSYESEGKASLAVAEYKKVIETNDHDQGVTARVFLGNVYAGLGNIRQQKSIIAKRFLAIPTAARP